MQPPIKGKRPGRRKLLAALLPVLVMGIGGQASAQQIEEILVTAQKREQSLQDVPIAVSAFQASDLIDAGIESQREIAMMTPNVAVNVNASFIAPYIRGVGTQYANPGLEPSVATYFNDIYISRPTAGFMQFADVERVEVLKGPQGTLYGRNTTGGAIRVITKDPTEDCEYRIAGTVGNYDKYAVDGFASGPLTDTLSGRISAQYEERAPWVHNITGGEDLEDRQLYMVHGKLKWKPTEQLTIKVDGDTMEKDDREGIAFVPLFDGGPEQTGAALGGLIATRYGDYSGNVHTDDSDDLTQHFDAHGGQARIDYDFESFTLSYIAGYRYMKFVGIADLDATSLPLFDVKTVIDKTEDYSHELQAVSSGEGPWDWVAGVYYMKEEAVDNFGLSGMFIEAGLFPGAWIGGDGEIEIESFAPYGQVSYDITDQWELMLGGRYTDETKDVKNDFYVTTVNGRVAPVKPYLQVIPVPDDQFEFDDFTPKVQVTWRPSDELMFYLSYSEGLKSGGFNMPSPSPAPVTKVNNETIESWELGWKTEFDRLRFNGAAFYYELADLQVQVTDLAGGITTVRNAGDATVSGIEGDFTFVATENLELGAGFGWQNAEFESVPGGNYNYPCSQVPTDPGCIALGGLGLATVIGDLEGNDLPHAPDWSGYGRGQYSWPLGDYGDLSFSVVSSYSGGFSYTPDNLYRENSKWLTNANASWNSADGRYQVSAYVTNLADQQYYTHNSPFAASGGWRVPGNPRMYGMRFAITL